MSTEINTENSTVNILLEINGEIHMVAMGQDELDAISFLVKRASKVVVPTGISQQDLNGILMRKKKENSND